MGRMGLFAGIKYDWQRWASDGNIIKKILWFIWLLVWTSLKIVGGIAGFVFKIFWSIVRANFQSSLFGGSGSSGSSSSGSARSSSGGIRNYQCNKCGTVVKSKSTPSAQGCPSATFHNWCSLGAIGDISYQCNKCGTVVQAQSTPSAQGCPNDTFHNWTKL
ncbi:MAG: hypothetical protein Ta2B_15060 [Termitinemataceae bacterium]|nr:MAG: hypothetical protein Ta2B_15060 [Termitinemataceae bacterium]